MRYIIIKYKYSFFCNFLLFFVCIHFWGPSKGWGLGRTRPRDVTIIIRMDMEDRLDPPSQGRQSVHGRTRKCQPARARIPERLFVT